MCKREREMKKKIEAVTDNAVSPTVRSLPASLSHCPRREKGRAEEQRRETLHYFRPFFSSLFPPPSLPVLWYNTLAVVGGAGCNVG